MKQFNFVVFFLLILACTIDSQSKQDKNQASSSFTPDCKKITCFGTANCTIIPANNKTKCVAVIQKVSQIEDVIRSNFNLTEDYFSGNSTLSNSTVNSTSSQIVYIFPIMLPLTFACF